MHIHRASGGMDQRHIGIILSYQRDQSALSGDRQTPDRPSFLSCCCFALPCVSLAVLCDIDTVELKSIGMLARTLLTSIVPSKCHCLSINR